MEEFNFEEIKNKALDQLKSDKSLLGKDAHLPLCLKYLECSLRRGDGCIFRCPRA